MCFVFKTRELELKTRNCVVNVMKFAGIRLGGRGDSCDDRKPGGRPALHNLASLADPTLHLSVETSPTGCSIVEMRPPSAAAELESALWYGHANAYLRLT